MYFFELYHQQSKHRPGKTSARQAPKDWPPEWKTTYFKTYPRFESISLPTPNPLSLSLSDCLLQRTSKRTFPNNISPLTLSDLLFNALGQKPETERRMYPSGGARYPLEFYLLINRSIGVFATGIYHYDIEHHALTCIDKKAFPDDFLSSLTLDDYLRHAQLTIFMTAVFERSSMKYQARSYRFVLLEAGSAAQNLSLCSTALGIHSLSLGGTIDTLVEDMLDVDGVTESLVHTMCFG